MLQVRYPGPCRNGRATIRRDKVGSSCNPASHRTTPRTSSAYLVRRPKYGKITTANVSKKVIGLVLDTKATPNLIGTLSSKSLHKTDRGNSAPKKYAAHQQQPAHSKGIRAVKALPQKHLERSTCPWSDVSCPEARECRADPSANTLARRRALSLGKTADVYIIITVSTFEKVRKLSSQHGKLRMDRKSVAKRAPGAALS